MANHRDRGASKGEVAGLGSSEALVLPGVRTEVRPPALYKVLLHNDDFTPMDFVVEILESIFHKANTLATQIMLDVHQKGLGVCGIYPYEVAETKVTLVIERAKKQEYPLKCTLEEE